jgi:hypothetical protein
MYIRRAVIPGIRQIFLYSFGIETTREHVFPRDYSIIAANIQSCKTACRDFENTVK